MQGKRKGLFPLVAHSLSKVLQKYPEDVVNHVRSIHRLAC
jgi:hypothetical protein